MICDTCNNRIVYEDKFICKFRYFDNTNDGYVKPGYLNFSVCKYDPILENRYEMNTEFSNKTKNEEVQNKIIALQERIHMLKNDIDTLK